MDYVIPATTQIQPESTEISDRWQGEDIRLPRTLRVGRGSLVIAYGTAGPHVLSNRVWNGTAA